MTTTHRSVRLARHATVVAAVVLSLAGLTACGSDSEDDGVASLADPTSGSSAADGSAAPSAGPSASGSLEEELLAYTSCLRDQGIDVPDIEVDADGNVQLGGGPGGQQGGQQGGNQVGGPAAIDPDELQAAQEVCGDPPSGLTSQLDQFDSPEFQDALLAFTQCLRDKGYDVADIDLGSGGPGQAAAGQNPLGDLDLSDPAVADDVDECQSSAFAGVDVPLPGGGN
jgi:hypothetical protein